MPEHLPVGASLFRPLFGGLQVGSVRKPIKAWPCNPSVEIEACLLHALLRPAPTWATALALAPAPLMSTWLHNHVRILSPRRENNIDHSILEASSNLSS